MTPYINEEVEALRELLPKGLFFVGSEARADKLRRYGQTAGKLHIAAHGIFEGSMGSGRYEESVVSLARS